MIRAKLIKKILVKTVTTSMVVTVINACLPLNDPRPDCFPDEGCERGKQCIAGKCTPPKNREILIGLECIQSHACRSSLTRYESVNVGMVNGGISAGNDLDLALEQEDIPLSLRACLIIEQPSQTIISFLKTTNTMQRAPLFTGQTRASLIVLSSDATCPNSEEQLKERGLLRDCILEDGCVLKLRSEQFNIGDETKIDITFNGDVGQCLETTWSKQVPSEECDQDDNDCDGFIDEGLNCSLPQSDTSVEGPLAGAQ